MSEPEEPNFMKDLEPISNSPVAPSTGIAAIALNFALRYHDINTVQDGTLYQQYKLEGKNFQALHLDMVFETAIKMERHLIAANERIAAIVVEALQSGIEELEEEEKENDIDNKDK